MQCGFPFWECGVGCIATPELKKLKHEREPFKLHINHLNYLSAVSFIVLDQ